MEIQVIEIPYIRLEWSDWVRWDELEVDARSGSTRVPNRIHGVYEVRLKMLKRD